MQRVQSARSKRQPHSMKRPARRKPISQPPRLYGYKEARRLSHSTIAVALFDIGAVKFGEFKLKSGLLSPIYIDLRLLASHPKLLQQIASCMAAIAKTIQFDRLAAIPYAALPIGVAVSLVMNRPLIYTRKEVKDYGTARPIEGEYLAGETVLLIDDLITKGHSKLEAIAPLVAVGLSVKDILVLIDREQGGAGELERAGYRLHAVLTLTALLDVLVRRRKITAEKRGEVLEWIRRN
ncbi:MAG TPA: orotate phosphoribosyltransferase [Anaerolineae bacterium]|nr:orotate phosphoribosyltransferase [Anaerolineae bacterium]